MKVKRKYLKELKKDIEKVEGNMFHDTLVEDDYDRVGDAACLLGLILKGDKKALKEYMGY